MDLSEQINAELHALFSQYGEDSRQADEANELLSRRDSMPETEILRILRVINLNGTMWAESPEDD